MFRASAPVTSAAFHDRKRELERMAGVFASLAKGAPKWLAILGARKVGKTSLLLEAARHAPSSVSFAVLDVMLHAPLSLELFRRIALRALDALVAADVGASLERLAHEPSEFRALLVESSFYPSLPRGLRSDLDRLPEIAATPDAARRWLDLPEELARALDRRIIVAIDEVQELAQLGSRGFEPFVVMRSVWQRHERAAYVISGSAPTMLEDLVTNRHSPFFQHFEVLELGSFERKDAIALLTEESPRERPIAKALAEKIVDVVGGHPFYLQLVGEAFATEESPYTEETIKPVLQSLIFSRTGRLALYFENEYARLVGRATTAAATLEALATKGPLTLTGVARAIGSSTASTARYLERVGDAIRRDGDEYELADPLFALWLRWRSPGGTVVPMTVVGDEAEQATARHLASLGFDLVYQSRGSRGAFDLLAIRGPDQLGVQVKRMALPLRFTKAEWSRMEADAKRWGWQWVIAAVDHDQVVTILDPTKAKRGERLQLAEKAKVENLLAWLDATRT